MYYIGRLGLDFDFEEPKALRICHPGKFTGSDETAMTFRDLDGSLMLPAGKTLVATDSFLKGTVNCDDNSNWKMSECQGKFARVSCFVQKLC